MKTLSIDTLLQDDKNANRGKKRGLDMLDASLKKLGAGIDLIRTRAIRKKIVYHVVPIAIPVKDFLNLQD